MTIHMINNLQLTESWAMNRLVRVEVNCRTNTLLELSRLVEKLTAKVVFLYSSIKS